MGGLCNGVGRSVGGGSNWGKVAGGVATSIETCSDFDRFIWLSFWLFFGCLLGWLFFALVFPIFHSPVGSTSKHIYLAFAEYSVEQSTVLSVVWTERVQSKHVVLGAAWIFE